MKITGLLRYFKSQDQERIPCKLLFSMIVLQLLTNSSFSHNPNQTNSLSSLILLLMVTSILSNNNLSKISLHHLLINMDLHTINNTLVILSIQQLKTEILMISQQFQFHSNKENISLNSNFLNQCKDSNHLSMLIMLQILKSKSQPIQIRISKEDNILLLLMQSKLFIFSINLMNYDTMYILKITAFLNKDHPKFSSIQCSSILNKWLKGNYNNTEIKHSNLKSIPPKRCPI